MNQIDLYIGLGILLFGLMGVMSGFLRSALSVVWTYLCMFLSISMGPSIIGAFTFLSVEEGQVGKVVMILAIFVILYLVGELLLFMLKGLVSITILGPVDKVLGGVVGAVKALLIAGFIFEVVLTLPGLSQETMTVINNSMLKNWGTQIFKSTYPMALALGGRAGGMLAGKAELSQPEVGQIVDLKVVTAEAGKVVETVKRMTP